MKNKKAQKKMNPIWIFLAILVVVVGFKTEWKFGFEGSAVDSQTKEDIAQKQLTACELAPTLDTDIVDKEDSTKVATAIKYKIDGGIVKTDADGTIDVKVGDEVLMLAGYNNASFFNPVPVKTTVKECGVNTFTYANMVGNASLTITCFNDEGNKIDGATNQTVGSGESVIMECQIEGVSDKGMPVGGVMVAELSGSDYKESDFSINGLGNHLTSLNGVSLTGNPVKDALSVYTISATANKVRAFEVKPIEGTGLTKFTMTLPAEDGTDASGDVTLSLYPIQGYHEEDVTGGDIRLGLIDLDNSFVASPVATATVYVD